MGSFRIVGTERDIINTRYVQVIEYLLENRLLKNKKELAEFMEESQNVFSQIKSGSRNASINQLNKLINGFGVNANFLFRMDASQEKILHHSDGTNASWSSQGEMTKEEFSSSIFEINRMIEGTSRESYHQISKLIDHHQFTMEKNKLLKEHIKSLEKAIKNLNKHLDDAKKTIQEKDKQLIELQSELIQAYKSYINK